MISVKPYEIDHSCYLIINKMKNVHSTVYDKTKDDGIDFEISLSSLACKSGGVDLVSIIYHVSVAFSLLLSNKIRQHLC